MNAVVAGLSFKDHAEDAMKLYCSVIRNSRIKSIVRSDAVGGPLPKGAVLHGTFELDGREFTAMDGGPSFSFAEGISLVATCDTQAELDGIWKHLAEGGEPGPCGWLKDRFGVSWQVVPKSLGEMLSDPKSGNPAKLMEALLKMGKIDIATLEKAFRQ